VGNKRPGKRERDALKAAENAELDQLRSKLAAAGIAVPPGSGNRKADLEHLRGLDRSYERDKARVRRMREKVRVRQERERRRNNRERRANRARGYSKSPSVKSGRHRMVRVKTGPGFVVAYRSGLFIAGQKGIGEPHVFSSRRAAEEVASWLGGNVYPADDPAVIGYETSAVVARERSDEVVAEGRVDALDMALRGGAFEMKRRKH
jgi:hypothetical protein